MKKCIKLAQRGEGCVSPNPLVGCVVLDKNGKEISSGYHKKYGDKHAEAMALDKLKNNEAEGGTLIVSFEPCSHFGKTPPCADLIIRHGLKRVVLAMKDPNPLVSGEGIRKLQEAGIEIVEDVLYEDAVKLNEAFIKNMTQQSIFVAIKTATTLDGKIATKTGSSKWITSEKARSEVQKLRNRYDAILTTCSTVIQDNPSMTCRLKNGRNPVKIILDRELKTDFNSKIYFSTGEKIYIIVDESIDEKRLLTLPSHIEVIKCPVKNLKIDMETLFKKLFGLNIMSVLVEAGGKLNGDLISRRLIDKIYQFMAPKILADNSGISAFSGRNIDEMSETIEFKLDSSKMFDSDILLIFYKK